MNAAPPVERLVDADAAAGDDVLCDAFRDYPVMRHVLAAHGRDARRLRTLVAMFTAGRWLRSHPVFGVRDGDGTLLAAATTTPPTTFDTPPALAERVDACWAELGADARRRYDDIRAAWQRASVVGRHWHVDMVGVVDRARRRGLAARLLQHVRALAAADGCAVALTTEDAANLPYYRRRVFRVVAVDGVGEALRTWTLIGD